MAKRVDTKVLIYRGNVKMKHLRNFRPDAKYLWRPGAAYKLKVRAMSYVFFAAPLMAPVEYQRGPPVAYLPFNNVVFRFPIPVMYTTPPVAIL